MKINFNEGGKWFTFYLNTKGDKFARFVRIWFGIPWRGRCICKCSLMKYFRK